MLLPSWMIKAFIRCLLFLEVPVHLFQKLQSCEETSEYLLNRRMPAPVFCLSCIKKRQYLSRKPFSASAQLNGTKM